VGTATLDDLTITASTAANSAVNITNLVVEDVTVGGTPVTAPSSPQAHPRRADDPGV
jgi:hypothetical protein